MGLGQSNMVKVSNFTNDDAANHKDYQPTAHFTKLFKAIQKKYTKNTKSL